MTKIFCDTHQAEFFAMNPDVPDNFFMLSKPEKTIPVLEQAVYPTVTGCKACMELPANAEGFGEYIVIEEVTDPPPPIVIGPMG